MLPMRVTSFLAGKSVHQAGLRMLPNAFLVALERRGSTIAVVAADEVLERDDLLWFAGTWVACWLACWLALGLSQTPSHSVVGYGLSLSITD